MKRNLFLLIAAGLVIAAILAAGGCSEKEVPYVIDDEVIRQYMEQSSDARELFRRDNLMLQTEYTVPIDPGAVFKVIVDSTRRRYDMNVFVDTVRVETVYYYDSVTQNILRRYDYHRDHHVYPAPLGSIWDGEVIVDDFYYTRELRIYNNDTTITPRTRAVTRYAWFLKLGNDSQPYRGWRLWAFNGGSPSTGLMTINAGNDTTFYGDLRGYDQITYLRIDENLSTGAVDTTVRYSSGVYMKVDRLVALDKGVTFYVTCPDVESRSFYRLATAYTDSGYVQSPLDRVNSTMYVDTIKTAANNSMIWNLLFMQNVTRIQEPLSDPPRYVYNWDGWCVPYRVNQ